MARVKIRMNIIKSQNNINILHQSFLGGAHGQKDFMLGPPRKGGAWHEIH